MNRKFIISFLQAVIVLPILSIAICMLGIPIGIIVAFFKTGVFSFESLRMVSIYESFIYAVKVGGTIGLVLGIGLWVVNIVIPELMNKSKNKK
ncbi:TPA: hypothetical protein IGZ61_004623 [Escherichia coli]|nr:hypothetical protein [Escherichia coli]